MTCPLDFKAKVHSLICTWQKHAWHAFPEIHLWCATFWPLGGQHGSWSLHHMPVSTAVGCQIRLGELPHSSQMSWMAWGNFCWISFPVMSLAGWTYSLRPFTTTSPCVASTYFRTATLQSRRKKHCEKKFTFSPLQDYNHGENSLFYLKIMFFKVLFIQAKTKTNCFFGFFIVFLFFCKRSISLSMHSHIPPNS